mmetsp:Transcript_56384/g.123184  ORF Transcript_56384/g.123184 Transcript_56384/m.123184 type:complete len:518 (-) Transcript_56384:205-1758(-)|eukprot:CAMPEP_0206603434 /NCGR_PEP_ID=MMETSP0325_2-20121206/48390_1 /ASSEMBLY_ACC=CAM_ASM_000347 /TAXON_ID=2866 /ORGANISM="Crypthecodinium cohnii, Strain Seligo" /LENGTH=517 /DNA_ID=CAMNT_0054116931 /DNA_START=30 /DNA_END=1583 /DNA_ORIENTATION=+
MPYPQEDYADAMLSIDSDPESGSDRMPASQGFSRMGRAVTRGLALTACAVCTAVLGFKALSPSSAISTSSQQQQQEQLPLQEEGAGGLGETVDLWYEGSDYGPMQAKMTEHLWEVERMLVGHSLCPAATPEIERLRKQHWPRKDAGKAPPVTKVFYINMDWDKARRDYMEAQLKSLSRTFAKEGSELSWKRIAGVPGSDLAEGQGKLRSWKDKGFSKAMTPDVRGDWKTASCTYNHFAAISRIPDTMDEGLVVIAEDDVAISKQFLKLWERLWEYVPEEWDVLRIGWFGDHQNCSQVVNPMIDVAGWQDPMEGQCAYCGAQAYIVNPESKLKVLERFVKSKITHADELLGAPTPALEDPEKVPPLRSYVVWPTLASTVMDAAGVPNFKSDRVYGRKAVGQKGGGDDHPSKASNFELGPGLKDLPKKFEAAVMEEIHKAELRGEAHARDMDSETLRKAVLAADRSEAEAKRAQKAAREAVAELEYDKANFYMTPKFVPLPTAMPAVTFEAPDSPTVMK